MIDYEYLLRNDDKAKEFRSTPLTAYDLDDQNPLDHLGGLLMLWPPGDIRFQIGNLGKEKYLMYKMFEGVETSLGARQYDRGVLDYKVLFQSNLDEFERFNQAAARHNREWYENGCPSEYVDPVTGDSTRVSGYVDSIRPGSKYSGEQLVNPNTGGELAGMRPEMKRKSYVLVRYQLRLYGTSFRLGYAAYDPKGRVVYYNQLVHEDLAYLVRRSVQELWGNPKVTDIMDGNLLDGISMLIQGKKIPYCRNNNTVPEFMGTEPVKIKTENTELKYAEFEQGSATFLEKATAGFIPVLIFIAMIMFTFFCIGQSVMKDRPVGVLFILGTAFFIGLLIGCRKLSQILSRKASEIDAEKRFM